MKSRKNAPNPTPPAPYDGIPEEKWEAVTKALIKKHPLDSKEIVAVVLEAWKDIFATRIGAKGYRIGTDITLSPQIMGSFLHELIPLIFRDRYPDNWRRQTHKKDKDLVYVPDPQFSVEIKTSSHPSQVFGNRSYAQPPSSNAEIGRKGKSGYYLAINFEKFSDDHTQPELVQIRFGWLDHTDWLAQKAATGQQARVSPAADRLKLVRLFPSSSRDPVDPSGA